MCEGVGKSQLDECLPRDANAPRFAVDGAKQVDREIDVHALDFPSRTPRKREVDMPREIHAAVMKAIELLGGDRLRCRGIAFSRSRARGGRR